MFSCVCEGLGCGGVCECVHGCVKAWRCASEYIRVWACLGGVPQQARGCIRVYMCVGVSGWCALPMEYTGVSSGDRSWQDFSFVTPHASLEPGLACGVDSHWLWFLLWASSWSGPWWHPGRPLSSLMPESVGGIAPSRPLTSVSHRPGGQCRWQASNLCPTQCPTLGPKDI